MSHLAALDRPMFYRLKLAYASSGTAPTATALKGDRS